MSDVNDIWDDEEDNEMVREMFGRRKTRDNYEDVNQPSKWIADKDAEILRLRADNERLRETLKPFAERIKLLEKCKNAAKYGFSTDIEIEHLRRAKEVYENTK